MVINQKTMDKMHDIQFEMLKELINVMDELQIKYYFVHGSLLGAIRDHDFIAEDDDIDIAIFRKDYDKLLKYGNNMLGNSYFLQNTINDNYPLAFAKMRNNNTTFWQPILDGYNCNQGMYIDIFPIDFTPNNSILFKVRIKLLNIRINSLMKDCESIIYKIAKFASKLRYPSLREAMLKREKLLNELRETSFVSIYGGKTSEFNMPIEWFGDGEYFLFRNILVRCPKCYKEYLTRIYGADYLDHNPALSRMDDKKRIEVSANIIDFEKSYKEYRN